MAKLAESVIVIKASKLLRDSENDVIELLDDETLSQIEAVIQELAGESTLVEIIKD